MFNELILEIHEGKIKLVVSNNFWCEVYWVTDKSYIALGADTIDRVVGKLLTAFNETERKYFEYKEMKLFTIINLMGPLATIAGKEADDYGIKLIFLDYKGNVTQLGVLSFEDKKVWIRKLTEYSLNNNVKLSV